MMRVLELYSGIGGMHYALQGKLLHHYILNKLNLYIIEEI